MAGSTGGKQGKPGTGAGNHARSKRRRTLLNLGEPFVPVDDFVNNAEDAMAVGFRVLEDVVKEIQQGYALAQKYNTSRQEAADAGGDAPPIPWRDLVDRAQKLQDISLDALERGSRILLESSRVGMQAATDLAAKVAETRSDANEKTPRLAGPVFDDPVTVKAERGRAPGVATWKIRHRGLARLRIKPQVTTLQLLDTKVSATLDRIKVLFEPAESDGEDVSVLTVDVGEILPTQPPGTYEGLITASNFELLIARLRVVVAGHADEPAGRQSANHGSPSDQRRTRPR